MRISELSRQAGVPVATIKYYLREGLLPAGRATGATQAEYGPEHADRLRLVRALVDVGRLPIASVKAVIAEIESEPADVARAVGTAHRALPPAVTGDAEPVRALAALGLLGWHVEPESVALLQLDAALAAAESLGMGASEERLRAFAAAALTVAEIDLDQMPAGDPSDAVRYAVLGTVMYEPILLALRRLAQGHVYAARGARPDPDGAAG